MPPRVRESSELYKNGEPLANDFKDATEEDGMEEIDLNNIVQGGRTRGATIDYAKAAQENPDADEDDEDDDDFQPPDEDTKMSE